MTGTADLIARFPKQRPPLSEAHSRSYVEEYRLNRDGARAVEGAAKHLEAWMHRRVRALAGRSPTLELGAGTLNHLPFEPETREYDIVEPFAALYAQSTLLPRVRSVFADQREIPTATRYRRIISIAVLEHMTDLPLELARSGLLLDADGMFQAGIPSEGGFLWGLAWRCTTGVSYRLRNGLDYGTLMRHEHVNTAREILALVRHFFREVRVARFPLPAHHASFYTYLEARAPDRDVCARVVAARAEKRAA